MEQEDAWLATELSKLAIRATAQLVIGLARVPVRALVPAGFAAATRRSSSQRTLDAPGPEAAPLVMFMEGDPADACPLR